MNLFVHVRHWDCCGGPTDKLIKLKLISSRLFQLIGASTTVPVSQIGKTNCPPLYWNVTQSGMSASDQCSTWKQCGMSESLPVWMLLYSSTMLISLSITRTLLISISWTHVTKAVISLHVLAFLIKTNKQKKLKQKQSFANMQVACS